MAQGRTEGAAPGPGDELPGPMGIGSLLEIAVRILRRHWAPLLGLALLFVGPAALLTASTGIRFNEVVRDVVPDVGSGVIEGTASLTMAEAERLVGALGAYLGATLLAGVLASVGALGASAVVAADYGTRRLGLGGALRISLRRAPSVLGVVVITSLVVVAISAIALGVALVAISSLGEGPIQRGGPGVFLAIVAGVAWAVAVVYLTMRWAVAFPAIAAEEVGWRGALERTWHLSGDNVWRVLLVSLLAAFLTAVFAALVSQLVALLLLAIGIGFDPGVVDTTAVALGTVLLAPLAPVLTAVLYFDLRARRDAPATAPSPASRPS